MSHPLKGFAKEDSSERRTKRDRYEEEMNKRA
jgi:hypothetical protein